MRSGSRWVTALAVTALMAASVVQAYAHEGVPDQGYAYDPADGPADDSHDKQHGGQTGHLPASSSNVELVSKLDLTGVPGGIADVAAFGNYAYLNTSSPECAGRPGAQGTGVHIVDISDPAAPEKVGFIPAHTNSYPGEGVHVMRVDTKFFSGDVLVHNNETCDANRFAPSGVSIWDVTDPTNPQPLALNAGDATPALPNQTFHTTHSVQGFTQPGKAFVVLQDNQETKDVDILDITNPRAPVMASERGIEDWPGAQGSYANGDSLNHHDMQYDKIGRNHMLLVSYWDAGQILLNVNDPYNPVFVTDSDYSSPDPEMPDFLQPEGNSHQSYWSSNGKYVLSSDEDFSPYRTLFQITSGSNAGPYGAGEFGWTVPVAQQFPSGMTGRTVFGGSGCEEDTNANGTSDWNEVPPASSSGGDVIVFSRGVCFFSKKVEAGQRAGYNKVIIGNSHGGSRAGLVPDAFSCGGQGHAFTITASAICIGHRAMHVLFNDPPAYAPNESATFGPGADIPIGTVGETISARTVFDGWGYVHLHDGGTLAELDTFAIPEALDEDYARGFGNLTVHEVKTDPRDGVNLAYMSYYDAGLRVASFGPDGIEEVGHFIDQGGNDFWGVFPHYPGTQPFSDETEDRTDAPLLLMSDRDHGLYILRFTG